MFYRNQPMRDAENGGAGGSVTETNTTPADAAPSAAPKQSDYSDKAAFEAAMDAYRKDWEKRTEGLRNNNDALKQEKLAEKQKREQAEAKAKELEDRLKSFGITEDLPETVNPEVFNNLLSALKGEKDWTQSQEVPEEIRRGWEQQQDRLKNEFTGEMQKIEAERDDWKTQFTDLKKELHQTRFKHAFVDAASKSGARSDMLKPLQLYVKEYADFDDEGNVSFRNTDGSVFVSSGDNHVLDFLLTVRGDMPAFFSAPDGGGGTRSNPGGVGSGSDGKESLLKNGSINNTYIRQFRQSDPAKYDRLMKEARQLQQAHLSKG